MRSIQSTNEVIRNVNTITRIKNIMVHKNILITFTLWPLGQNMSA